MIHTPAATRHGVGEKVHVEDLTDHAEGRACGKKDRIKVINEVDNMEGVRVSVGVRPREGKRGERRN